MFDRTSLYLRFDIDRTSLWHRLESKDVTKGKREQCEKLTNEHWGLAVVHRTPVRERSLSPVHPLMTDAYAAYAYFNKIKDCTHVCCWAHARRIFYYSFKDYKDKFAKAFLDLIECLYKIEVEHIIFQRTEEEIVNIRNKEAIPILHTLNQKDMELLSKYDESNYSAPPAA